MLRIKFLAMCVVSVLLSTASFGEKLMIAEKTKTRYAIVLADNAILPEKTAAGELAHYLKKVTGAEFAVMNEAQGGANEKRIYIGPTKYAQKHGVDCKKLGPEKWIVKTVGDNLILAGGRPRGTIYAVYHFLEDVIGVHWWSPWAESVPSKPDLSIGSLNEQGEPALVYRDLNTVGGYMGKNGSSFAPRNRINRELVNNVHIPFKYGGENDFGPPNMNHTECKYFIPLKKTASEHPDWFAMKNGKRRVYPSTPLSSFSKNQMCLSNQEMRKEFLRRLKGYIRKTRKLPVPPMLFDVSLNDTREICQCPACKKLVKKYGGFNSGLLLDFVNYMADGIKDDYPDVMIRTLAYNSTEHAPKRIVPRPNVIITLCDTKSTYTKPVPHDEYLAERLAEWLKISKKVFIWDYHSNFRDYALPMPFESTFQEDLKFFKNRNVIGYMSEYHSPIYEDLRDLRLWLLAKLMENPYRDQDKLIQTFTSGFYGPAAVYIRQYITTLGKAARAHPSYIYVQGKTEGCKYLTPSFILKVQAIFDRAEEDVKNSEILLRRVRHARLAVDKAALAIFPKIAASWKASGKKPEDLPLDKNKISARLKDTIETQYKLRFNFNLMDKLWQKKAVDKKAQMLRKIDQYLKRGPVSIKPPAKFAALSKDDYSAFGADVFGYYTGAALKDDKQTQSGIAAWKKFDKVAFARLKGNALGWSVLTHGRPAVHSKAAMKFLKFAEISGPGYHWYKLGTYTISEGDYLWIYGSNLAVDLEAVRDPLNPSGKYDIWACVKFEGPAFKTSGKAKENAVSVEWIAAVKENKI